MRIAHAALGLFFPKTVGNPISIQMICVRSDLLQRPGAIKDFILYQGYFDNRVKRGRARTVALLLQTRYIDRCFFQLQNISVLTHRACIF